MLGATRTSSTSRVDWWPPLDATDGARLAARPRVPGPGRRGRRSPPRSSGCSPSRGTPGDGRCSVEDVPLLDELRYALGDVPAAPRGPPRARRPRGRGDMQELTTAADREYAPAGRAWTPPTHRIEDDAYAHVLVDEAQDLTPMQWRMVGRRGRAASWTIVGDPAQSSWPVPDESAAARAAALERQARSTSSTSRRTTATPRRSTPSPPAYAERVGLDADLPTRSGRPASSRASPDVARPRDGDPRGGARRSRARWPAPSASWCRSPGAPR